MSPDRTGTASLHEVGVICALGSGAAALRAALSPRRPAALPLNSPFWPRAVPQGLVAEPLPSLDAHAPPLRTRCNALLLSCYRQIEAGVRDAIARHGAGRVAIVLGTSTSGIGEAQQAFTRRGPDGTLPQDFDLDQQGLGTPAEFLAGISGARGPVFAISTACTSAPKALASAARLLAADLADVVVAGGVDALNRFTLAGFDALACVSSRPCNPMSVNRDGINMGEGAALFLMSREPGAIRLGGWGESSDAHHFSAPDPQGTGATLAMRAALAMARAEPADIDYVNLHGTATPQNDAMESTAVAALFGAHTPCSSTKPLTGHALGAAGAIEAAICWQVLRQGDEHADGGALPPHWWDGAADPALPQLALVAPGTRTARPPRRVLSNSFAFGGSNAALVLERADAG
jgi:3-oxoacyl-[acyl-carrier-protein] synthase-1